MTDKDKYLIELFDKYNEIFEHCNKPCKNMYSKDEFWARHSIFKDLQKDMRSYSYKIFMDNLKLKIRNFFNKFKRKKNKHAKCIVLIELPVPAEPIVPTEPINQSEPIVPIDPATETDTSVQSVQADQGEPTASKIKRRRGRPRKIL